MTEKQRMRRYERALKMREKGLTFRKIGDKLGVSAVRARQIYLDAKRELA